jgi:Mn2+/Fe2+ NRAMP family transporter
MSSSPSSAADPARVPAGYLPPWTLGNLPPPPAQGWRSWFLLLGPGVLLAGSSIGTGEWLFGPAVSAQYGGSLLWLAGLSIVGQVFCNLQMMSYAVYCGESIIVGYLRTWPGPRFWMLW